MDLAGTVFYYTNPLDANAQRTPWHNCPCCVGNIPRTMLMLPTWTYSKGADALYVNLFVGSRGRTWATSQAPTSRWCRRRDYPWDGAVTLTINPKTPKTFAVRIRAPKRDVSSLYRAMPAGDGITPPLGERRRRCGRASPTATLEIVARAWKRGDTIAFTLPMPVQRVYGSDRIISGSDRPSPVKDKVALRVGPLVYNIEQVDQDITGALPPDGPSPPSGEPDLLGGVNVVTGRFADGAADDRHSELRALQPESARAAPRASAGRSGSGRSPVGSRRADRCSARSGACAAPAPPRAAAPGVDRVDPGGVTCAPHGAMRRSAGKYVR